MKNESNEIVMYESSDGVIKLPIRVDYGEETVWLNRGQIAELFDRDIKTIGKHINNSLKEELADQVVVAKFATTTPHGAIEGKTQTHMTEFYNLEVIMSVGYRVKSRRGIEFRKWANSVLRDYIMKGYAVNNNRIKELGEVIRLMKRTEQTLDAKQVLSVVEKYNMALDMLDDYDHQSMKRPQGNEAIYVLTYEECRKVIDEMNFSSQSSLFGNEKDDSFKGSIGNIYQSFAGQDLYPSIEEKAANLLYLITKNHSFFEMEPGFDSERFIEYQMSENQIDVK